MCKVFMSSLSDLPKIKFSLYRVLYFIQKKQKITTLGFVALEETEHGQRKSPFNAELNLSFEIATEGTGPGGGCVL